MCSAGNLTNDEVEKIMAILANHRQFKIPDWFLNRRKDLRDGKTTQVTSNDLMTKLREDIEGLKKIRCVDGVCHPLCCPVVAGSTRVSLAVHRRHC